MTPLLLAAPVKIKTPSLQYGALSPMLIVFGVALAGVLVEAFLPNKYRRTVQPFLAIARLRGRAGGGRRCCTASVSCWRPARSRSTVRRCSSKAPSSRWPSLR